MRSLAVLVTLLPVFALVLFGVGYLVHEKVLKPRREARWEAAKQRATWQDIVTSKDGKTTVLVQRVAVDGNRREVLDQHFVGTVYDSAENWDAEVDAFRVEALRRVYQLNTGPLS